MKASVLVRELRHVFDAKESDIPCSECFDRLSDYVDHEIAGEPIDTQMPEVKYHLEHCRVCGEEYTVLRDLARLEVDGQSPTIEEMRKSL